MPDICKWLHERCTCALLYMQREPTCPGSMYLVTASGRHIPAWMLRAHGLRAAVPARCKAEMRWVCGVYCRGTYKFIYLCRWRATAVNAIGAVCAPMKTPHQPLLSTRLSMNCDAPSPRQVTLIHHHDVG